MLPNTLKENGSPLARLVLFMVCISLAGVVLAGVYYVAVDLPYQKNLQAPTNEQGFCGACCKLTQCLAVDSRKNCDEKLKDYGNELLYCPD